MIPERYVMVLLCATCCFINYADRVNMSVAIIAIAEQYKFSVEQQGIIMSTFFLGYLPMQIGGAVLCRRFGGKAVLSYGAFLWSTFTILTPFAARAGYHVLLLCRVLMGLSEGVAFPSVFHFLSSWIPASERSRAIAVFLSGVHIGTTVALLLSPMIIRWHSWELIFYSFGAAGWVWIIFWTLLAYDRDGLKSSGSGPIEYKVPSSPVDVNESADSLQDQLTLLEHGQSKERRRRTSSDSLDNSAQPVEVTGKCDPSEVGKALENQGIEGLLSRALKPSEVKSVIFIVTDSRCLSVCITQALFGLIHYTIMSWLPSYFKNVFNTDTGSLSFTFIPYFSMAISANLGGVFSDQLVGRGISLTRSRKTVTLVANIGAASMLIAFSVAQTVTSALAFISLSMAFMSLNSGGFESSFLDMSSPDLTGLFKAVANTMGSFSGLFAIPFAAVVLRWSGESWRFVFGSLVFWYFIVSIIFCWFATSDRVLTEQSGQET